MTRLRINGYPIKRNQINNSQYGLRLARSKRVEFYLRAGMITKLEVEAILKGDMVTVLGDLSHSGKPELLNLNADRHITTLRTGERGELYIGRAEDIAKHLLFGLPMPDRNAGA